MHEYRSAKHEATENCYYKKLLKAKLTTSKDIPSVLFLQRYVQPQ